MEDVKGPKVFRSVSPSGLKEAPAGMDFPAAIRAVMAGHRVTRSEWEDREVFGLKRDGLLMIKTKDGYHQWIVSDGDMLGMDWEVVG
jgi:hypothetical protein